MLNKLFIFLTTTQLPTDITIHQSPRQPHTSDMVFDAQLLQGFDHYLYKIILPVVIIIAFSLYVGLERQNMGKSAGVSAHTIVGLASVMIAIVQRLMYEYSGFQNNDGQRIIAQVVTGIGFLGAGVIMKDKYTIKGLTTAATIWATAILGIILGSGYLIIGSLFAIIVVVFITIRDVKRGFNPFKRSKTLTKDFNVKVRRYKIIENQNNNQDKNKKRLLRTKKEDSSILKK